VGRCEKGLTAAPPILPKIPDWHAPGGDFFCVLVGIAHPVAGKLFLDEGHREWFMRRLAAGEIGRFSRVTFNGPESDPSNSRSTKFAHTKVPHVNKRFFQGFPPSVRAVIYAIGIT
jgi:hypothetical protein